MATQKTLITAEDLLMMSSRKRCELVRGELREMVPAGYEHGIVAGEACRHLGNFVEDKQLGVALAAETGFHLARDPDTVRAPDVAFIARDRIPTGKRPVGYPDIAPDLTLEVVSPGDRAKEIREKVHAWLAAGVRLVVVLYSDTRTAVLHYPDGTARALSSADILDLAPVLPGFAIPVAALL